MGRSTLRHPAFWATAFVLAAAGAAWMALPPATPSGTHDWIPEQSVLPAVRFEGSRVHVDGVRSFVWGKDGAAERRWVDRSYDLDRIESVWFGLSPFASWRGPAHAFLSFAFADSQFVTVSVEARREVGESYSPLRGLLRQYELIFVVGDEADVIGLRTHVWGDPVYLYPTVATPAQARDLFVALLRRVAALREAPEYYNTFDDNCATNLADALQAVRSDPVGWSPSLVLPGYSDEWAMKLGLLAVSSPVDAARARYRINDRAEAAFGTPDFSFAIRR